MLKPPIISFKVKTMLLLTDGSVLLHRSQRIAASERFARYSILSRTANPAQETCRLLAKAYEKLLQRA